MHILGLLILLSKLSINLIFFQSQFNGGKNLLLNFRSKPNFPDNRRKIAETNFSPLVYKRAEDIAGYQKFTLDEVIYPDKVSKFVFTKSISKNFFKIKK